MTYRELGEPGGPSPEILTPEPQLQIVEVEAEQPAGPDPWTITAALEMVEDCWGSSTSKYGSN